MIGQKKEEYEWLSFLSWLGVTGLYGYWSLHEFATNTELAGILISFGVMLALSWLWSRDRLFIGLMVLGLWLTPMSGPGMRLGYMPTISMSVSQIMILMMMFGALMVHHPLKGLNKRVDWMLLLISGVYVVDILWGKLELHWYLMWWWQFIAMGYLVWGFVVYIKERWLGVGMVLAVMLMLVTERLVSWVGGMW